MPTGMKAAYAVAAATWILLFWFFPIGALAISMAALGAVEVFTTKGCGNG